MQFIVGCIISYSYYFVEYDILIYRSAGPAERPLSTFAIHKAGKELRIDSYLDL